MDRPPAKVTPPAPRRSSSRRSSSRRTWLWRFVLLSALAPVFATPDPGGVERARPNVFFVTVDTLRFDRLSLYGHYRDTSPHLDSLLESGAHFTEARVVEPLTAPSMVSMITSLHPHEHGTSRNGLRMRPELPSLPKVLRRRGYRTAAFVGNWTLKDEISGLGEHFAEYREVFSRKRWLFFFGEATADDLTDEALEWLEERMEEERPDPLFLWIHYVEPHAPYRFQDDFAERLGIERHRGEPTPSERYDTEVAFVDRSIGRLVAGIERLSPPEETLIVFASDHGESLGEHNYWGHGRHLYEPTLKIPMGISWPGRVDAGAVTAPASIIDLAPTVFGLAGWPIPETFRGFDWSPVLRGEAEPPHDRVTHHQAHKGAVQRAGNRSARRQGLLEVGRVAGGGRKEVFRVRNDNRWLFDLEEDPSERNSLVREDSEPSEELREWLLQVRNGLTAADELPPPELDAESEEKLRALGYVD